MRVITTRSYIGTVTHTNSVFHLASLFPNDSERVTQKPHTGPLRTHDTCGVNQEV